MSGKHGQPYPESATSPERDQLFISYSHDDRPWVDRLQKMIRPLVRSHGLRLWDDSLIQPGDKWKEEIETALASARVALLLVSADFLASEFVTNSELPELLGAAEEEGLRILWVHLRPSLVRVTPIYAYQALLDPGRPLSAMDPVEQEEALVKIALAIQETLGNRQDSPPGAAAKTQRDSSGNPREASTPRTGTSDIPSSDRQAVAAAQPEVAEPAASTAAPAATDSWPLQRFTTTTCLLRQAAGRWRVERRPLQVEGYREGLAEGVELTMVKIPAGTFLMGSSEEEQERSDDEGPQHEVTLGAFFLAQTPITQAQWRAVADWEKVERALEPDPSEFKGPNRPVENVSWWDAVEFCRRLSQRTGKSYGQPSEAQWEYACRAGSTTPFHYGETLTPELANYDGNSIYGNGPKGSYRKLTTEVGTFPANAWGLQDMHGNVWEWCGDHWHASYDFAPADDQLWLIPAAGKDEERLLRGGSWYSGPVLCRSAYRNCGRPGDLLPYNGVRPCCLLPPGAASQP